MKSSLSKGESKPLVERSLAISTGANKSMCACGMNLNMCVFSSSVCDGDGLVTNSCPWILMTLWTVACQAPLSMGFPRQECWSGLPFPSPGDLPDPNLGFLHCRWSPAFQVDSLLTELPGEALVCVSVCLYV